MPNDKPSGKQRQSPRRKGAQGKTKVDDLYVWASDVRSTTIRWAEKGRLPLGYPVVMSGVEGLGKSLFAAREISSLSKGELPGVFEDRGANTLIVAEEDGIEDMWKPRLDLVDADMSRVAFLQLERFREGWDVYHGTTALAAVQQKTKARLIFIDAVMEHMPPSKGREGNVSSPDFVRRAFQPLRRLCRARQLVALYSMHPPKGKPTDFRSLYQNSQAFAAVPRVALYLAYHPDDAELDQDDQRRVLVRPKGNIGRNPGALSFRVSDRLYEADDGRKSRREFVTDISPCDVTITDLLADAAKVNGNAPDVPKIRQSEEFISGALIGGEERPGKPIEDALLARGIGKTTIKDARTNLGVKTRKDNRKDGISLWRLVP